MTIGEIFVWLFSSNAQEKANTFYEMRVNALQGISLHVLIGPSHVPEVKSALGSYFMVGKENQQNVASEDFYKFSKVLAKNRWLFTKWEGFAL